MQTASDERRERILVTIESIPKGRVATYGTVAKEAGLANGARQVAWALRTAKAGREVPWQRVLGAGGRIVLPKGAPLEHQAKLLRREGVLVSETGRVDMKRFAWKA